MVTASRACERPRGARLPRNLRRIELPPLAGELLAEPPATSNGLVSTSLRTEPRAADRTLMSIGIQELDRLRNLGDGAFERLRRLCGTSVPAHQALSALHTAGHVWRRWRWLVLALAILVGAAWVESCTSVLESGLFSVLTSRLHYVVEPEASSSIRFPHNGPLDSERGYDRIPS